LPRHINPASAPEPAPGRRISPGRPSALVLQPDQNLPALGLFFQTLHSFICRGLRLRFQISRHDRSRSSQLLPRSSPFAPALPTPGLPSENRRFRLATFAGDPHPRSPFPRPPGYGSIRSFLLFFSFAASPTRPSIAPRIRQAVRQARIEGSSRPGVVARGIEHQTGFIFTGAA